MTSGALLCHLVQTATPKYPEVSQAYRAARKQRGVSQEKLAAAVGTSRRHIIRIENGENRPTSELRDRLAAALGVDSSTLPSAADGRPFSETTSGTGS